MENNGSLTRRLPDSPQPPSARLSPYRAALVAADPKMAPASADQLRAILGRLRLHYGMPDLTPEQYRLFWADYADDLGHVPADVLEMAAVGWRRRVPAERFFPKPADLLTVIRAQRVFEERTRRAREQVEASRRSADYEPSADDKARAAKLLAELKSKISAAPMPKAGPCAPDRKDEPTQAAKPTESEIRDFEARKQAVLNECRAAGLGGTE